jgi:hypothetical protein
MTSKDLASGFCTVEPDCGNWPRPTVACASRNGKTNIRLIQSLFSMRLNLSEIKRGTLAQFHKGWEKKHFLWGLRLKILAFWARF